MANSNFDDPCDDAAYAAPWDAELVAARAGLVRRGDDRPGIRRRRAGAGFSYVDPAGPRVQGEQRAWIESLAIPPAWSDVWISPEPDSHLLASGVDDAGRKQYRYHQRWIDAANAVKFERLAGFPQPLAKLRAEVTRSLRDGRDDDWVCAAVVRLIDRTLIRPGSFRHFRERGTVGAVTLQPAHVTLSRRRVQLSFAGKSHVEVDVVCEDPLLARRMTDLVDAAEGQDALFVDGEGRAIDADRVNAYIRRHAGDGFTAKDLRTWGATSYAAEQLATRDPVHDGEAAVRDAIAAAADRLGNTVAVCRSSYVAPAVLDAFRSGALRDAWRGSRRARWLSRAERTVHRVLASHGARDGAV